VAAALPGRWRELDGLRAAGMLMVFVYHAWGVSGQPVIAYDTPAGRLDFTGLLQAGALGTTLIFALAGFFAQLPHERARQAGRHLPGFAESVAPRLLRLAPVYYAASLTGLLVIAWSGRLPREGVAADLLLDAAFLQNLSPTARFAPVGSLWAIAAVALFYALSPALARLLAGRRWIWGAPLLLGITLASRMLILGDGLDTWWLEHKLPPRLDSFVFGMLAAKIVAAMDHHPRRREWVARRAAWLSGGAAALAVLAVGLAADSAFNQPGSLPWHAARPALGAAAFLAMPMLTLGGSSVAQRLLRHRIIAAIGVASYSAFVWHLVAFDLLWSAGGLAGLNPPDQFKVCLTAGGAITAVLSALSYAALERPFLSDGAARHWLTDRRAAFARRRSVLSASTRTGK
jgi:peptidoglycan/LPS O-acetylase OafA/YrhL